MKIQDSPLQFRVATPCQANWDEMTGDEQARFCRKCSKYVYNLSSMSAAEAERLIREKEGKLCVRFYQRSDGTVLHGKDCPVGLAARQWGRVKGLAGAFVSLLLLILGLNKAQAGNDKAAPAPSANLVMGDYCVPQPAPTPTPSPTLHRHRS